jgi:hypothetical protein
MPLPCCPVQRRAIVKVSRRQNGGDILLVQLCLILSFGGNLWKLTSYRGYQHGENHVESNKKYFMEIQPAEIAI